MCLMSKEQVGYQAGLGGELPGRSGAAAMLTDRERWVWKQLEKLLHGGVECPDMYRIASYVVCVSGKEWVNWLLRRVEEKRLDVVCT